jgi:RNA polymerase sigma-70 factor (ECF subfamily)|tara:strand:- start:745 stop:1386 length:642 start_codon:yes stop_codon:yes gene_type:complete
LFFKIINAKIISGEIMAKVKNPFVDALKNIAERQDIGSFKKIFDYFGPRLKSFLMKSGADEAIAEEIIQETMTIIWTKADYYDSSVASPSTWIYTIARNKKIDILRKTRKAILEDIDTAILPPVESKADENIEHDQKFEMVAKYLDDLPKDQLDLLKMNFFEEKSHGEIAEITKIPLGTVKSRIRLALEKIRGKLEQDGSMANLISDNESMVN